MIERSAEATGCLTLGVRMAACRSLANLGATSALLNRARMQLAPRYLANPRMRITDIADLLGYSSIGAFMRWCMQSLGQSPLGLRKAG